MFSLAVRRTKDRYASSNERDRYLDEAMPTSLVSKGILGLSLFSVTRCCEGANGAVSTDSSCDRGNHPAVTNGLMYSQPGHSRKVTYPRQVLFSGFFLISSVSRCAKPVKRSCERKSSSGYACGNARTCAMSARATQQAMTMSGGRSFMQCQCTHRLRYTGRYPLCRTRRTHSTSTTKSTSVPGAVRYPPSARGSST